MDYVAHVPAARIPDLGVRPGTMHLVDEQFSRELRNGTPAARILPGGSCANTMRGLGWLNATAGAPLAAPLFLGVVGDDAQGREYGCALQREGVAVSLLRRSEATATSTVLVTPGGERTMFTCLAASPGFAEPLWPPDALATAGACYATAFLCDTPSSWRALCRCAAEAVNHRVPVVFDLADPLAVERHRRVLGEWLPNTVSVLIGNRDELLTLTRCTRDRDALATAGTMASVVVMKTGASGALVWHCGELRTAPTTARVPVDTTGAGDAFSAGFLYRWLASQDAGAAAAMGNAVAGVVLGVEGCDYTALGGEPALRTTGNSVAGSCWPGVRGCR